MILLSVWWPLMRVTQDGHHSACQVSWVPAFWHPRHICDIIWAHLHIDALKECTVCLTQCVCHAEGCSGFVRGEVGRDYWPAVTTKRC